MSEIRIPQSAAFLERASRLWQSLIAPSAFLSTVAERRKAQLLAVLTLILAAFLTVALIVRFAIFKVTDAVPFLSLTIITLVSYALSRTRYYQAGNYLFAWAFTALGFIRIYQGASVSIEASVVSTVHIALALSSALLPRRGFILLVVTAAAATFTAPLYASTAADEASTVGRLGGVVLTIGAILYGFMVFRESLEREQRLEMGEANRKLQDAQVNLEKRIEERTREYQSANLRSQERANRLQNITEISREIAAGLNLNLDELLMRVARLISEKLGYYHAGIFLIDATREFAVLRAANSKGGQEMLARGHQLKIGGTGIVGYVSQSGSPRIALDTGVDAVFFNNPYLPETRSEISLPIKFGNTTLGVLDVQSTQSSAFSDEDTNTLMTIANQLALIVGRKAEFGGATPQGARHPLPIQAPQAQLGYTFTADGSIVESRGLPSSPYLERAVKSGDTVSVGMSADGGSAALIVPVKFREQVVGVIQIEANTPARTWTENEILLAQAVSDRAALALDNAGLFEEATRRAEQEEAISRITNQIGASTDFERIMQTTIQELGQALGASRSFIHIGAPPGDKEAAK